MPLRKPNKTHDHRKDGNKAATQSPFPPEAYKHESDVTDKVVGRVQAEADKILNEDEWDVIDGEAVSPLGRSPRRPHTTL